MPNRSINWCSTGLRPVVSGVSPETWGVTRSICVETLRNVHPGFAMKIRRDAEFDGRDARATTD